MQYDIIPLHINEKRPFGDNWQHTKWTEKELFDLELDGHNFGVRLRKIDLVIDFDVKYLPEDTDKEMFIWNFLWEFGIDTSSIDFVRTPSGGAHIYLQKDPSVKIKRYLPEYGRAIEFKTFGSQVVAAGSKIDGKTYVKEISGNGAIVPQSLLELLSKKLKKSSKDDILPLSEIKQLLNLLPADSCSDYDTWLKVGQAIHSGSEGSDEGEDLFAVWSESDDTYFFDGAENARKKWATFSLNGDINVHFIKKCLKERGIELPRPKALDVFADEPLGEINSKLASKRPKPLAVSNFRYETEKEIRADCGDDEKLLAKRLEKPRVLQITTDTIFQNFSDAARDRLWGIYLGNLILVSEDGNSVEQHNPKHFRNFLSRVGVQTNWKSKSSSQDALINMETFGSYITAIDHKHKITEVQRYPSWPISPNAIYVGETRNWHKCGPLVDGKLDEFIDFFKPASWFDRKLIKAFFLTMLWNAPGQKPVFTITSSAEDIDSKKNSGKTTLIQMLGRMALGDVGNTLKHEGRHDPFQNQMGSHYVNRGVDKGTPTLFYFDNFGLNSDMPETFTSIIGHPEFNIRPMYKGDIAVPNNFTFAMSTNHVAVTKDLTDRFQVIYLDSLGDVDMSKWERDILEFIQDHREDCVREALQLLQTETTGHVQNFSKKVKFWASEILSRVITEKEWTNFCESGGKQIRKDKELEGLDQDIEIFADFKDHIFNQLESIGIHRDSYHTILVRHSLMKDFASSFARKHPELRIKAKYFMENLNSRIPEISKKIRCRKTWARGVDVHAINGNDPSGKKEFIDIGIIDRDTKRFGEINTRYRKDASSWSSKIESI